MNNYYPIGISSVCSIILERTILDRIEIYVVITDNQFGFERYHSTKTCIFLLKEILQYFKRHDTISFLCFMDASKAFDRINHGKLLNILQEYDIPPYILRILDFGLSHHQLQVKWNHICSDLFLAHNGVRQGGILSPYLFNMYVNKLSTELNKGSIGCLLNQGYINHLLHADDIVLISPSAKGLQQLVTSCSTVGNELNIVNDSKTVCMTICTKADQKCKTLFPDMYLKSKKLLTVDIYKYLGHYITSTLSVDKDIIQQIRLNYARGNMLCCNFMYYTDDMKCMLFRSYMYNMYTLCLWTNYTQSVYNKLMVTYKNSFHFLLKYPRSCSASEMFVHHNVKSFPECVRTVS